MANSVHQSEEAVIHIAATVLHELQDHMKSSPSTEVCGILLGKTAAGGTQIHSYRRLRNVAPDPLHHFQLHPYDWIQCCYQEPELIGLFHSHPNTAPLPSQEDLERLPDFANMISVYLIGSPFAVDSELEQNDPLANVRSSLRNQHQPIHTPTDPIHCVRAYNVIRQSAPPAPHSARLPLPYALLPAMLRLH